MYRNTFAEIFEVVSLVGGILHCQQLTLCYCKLVLSCKQMPYSKTVSEVRVEPTMHNPHGLNNKIFTAAPHDHRRLMKYNPPAYASKVNALSSLPSEYSLPSLCIMTTIIRQGLSSASHHLRLKVNASL